MIKSTNFIKDNFRKCNFFNNDELKYTIDKFINSLISKDHKY